MPQSTTSLPQTAPEEKELTSAAPKSAPRSGVRVDDSHAAAAYANFCRVTGTPEEMILDFGLNAQPFGTHAEPLPINQRIVMNFYTAKRMLHALQVTLQRHEAAFGALETDVQKRVVPGAKPRSEVA
ncbi:MAG: DUF3467 domain-containing protein [Pirellulales bacterium]|nr:DUF3467 domain-containing protein [Pirellulales bacterium]